MTYAYCACYTVQLLSQATLFSFIQIGGHRTGPGPTSVLSTTRLHGVMQQQVHQSWVHNIDKVKEHLLNLCHRMDHSAIDNGDDEWRGHLHACVRENGLHFSS